MEKSFVPIEYKKEYEPLLFSFLEKCLPESGREFEINGRHSVYKDIDKYYTAFRCMFDGGKMIGVSAVKELDGKSCELKSLYLLEHYHGRGYGKCLIQKAISYAKEQEYEKMYLDTFSTSTKAIALYRKTGFADTERYNNNERADVFMVMKIE